MDHPRTSSHRRIALGAIIVIATFVSYFPAIRSGFIWDDDQHVYANPTLRHFDGLGKIWFDWNATPQYYPLTHTSFWIEYRFWQADPLGYHSINVLLHSINALLLWRFLDRLKIHVAWVIACVFALHPINVESVAWITERKNVLSMCFAMLSMLMFLRDTHKGYAGSIATFLCAMLSKTIAVAVPPTLLVILWWQNGRITRRDVLRVAPLFVIGVAMGLMTAWLERHHVGASGIDWQFAFADRILIAGRSLWFYVGKVLWPAPLIFSYPRWEIDSHVWWQWIFPTTFIVILAGSFLMHKKIGRGPAAGMMIFVIGLFPALGFVDVYPMRYSFVADHFVYLAAPAMIVLVVAGLAKRNLQWLVIALLPVLSVMTWRQSRIYLNEETLWRDTIAKNPQSWMAMHNLGVVAMKEHSHDRHRLEEGLDWLDRSERLHPDELLAVDRADVLAALGEDAQAEAIYRAYLQKYTAYSVRLKLARLLEKLGRSDEAMTDYQTVLSAKPDDPTLLSEIGLLMAVHKGPAESLPYLEKFVALQPEDADGHVWLGFAYGELGQLGRAKEQFEQALAIDPESARAKEGMKVIRQASLPPALQNPAR